MERETRFTKKPSVPIVCGNIPAMTVDGTGPLADCRLAAHRQDHQLRNFPEADLSVQGYTTTRHILHESPGHVVAAGRFTLSGRPGFSVLCSGRRRMRERRRTESSSDRL